MYMKQKLDNSDLDSDRAALGTRPCISKLIYYTGKGKTSLSQAGLDHCVKSKCKKKPTFTVTVYFLPR